MGCLPNSTPPAYPPMSLATDSTMKVSTRSAPSGDAAMSAANAAA